MKRFLLLFVSILIVSLSFKVAFAKDENPAPDLSEEKQATSPAFIKYNLAYPGILPDHPLHKLKVLRDKISAVLISDPRKKIDFYLLQADKGILASAMLVDKGKVDLAAETALKAEHYYTLITQELYKLPTRPQEDLYKKLKTASLKHREVLSSLTKRVPKEKRKTFLTVNDFSKRNWQSIEEYKEFGEEISE